MNSLYSCCCPRVTSDFPIYKAPSFSPSKIESNNISNITVSSYTSHGFIIKKEKSKVSSNNICLKQTNDTDLEEFYTKQKISQSDIIIHKKLLISEVEGHQLNQNDIIVNCGGMLNGHRNRTDGIALFGLGKIDNNDFTFTSKGNSVSIDHLFFIYYSIDKRTYYIRTYTMTPYNFIFLVQINRYYEITQEEYFMLGDVFFIMTPEKKKITISIYKNGKVKNEKEFIANEEDESFTIGRSIICNLPYKDDKSFSKVHCTIKYINNQWWIIDGTEKKKSTNGVWLIPNKSYEIYDGINFKILGCSKCVIRIKD